MLPLTDSLHVLHEARRGDEVVVTTMGTAREWMALGAGLLDWVYVPSSMGQATSIGLGVAVARPDVNVVVANGDGSLLMNLGSLATISAVAPRNLTVLVFDNGVYEVTGGQPTPGSPAARVAACGLDYSRIAAGCGFDSVHEVERLQDWRSRCRRLIDETGPTFVHLRVAPTDSPGPRSPGPAPARAESFREALKAR